MLLHGRRAAAKNRRWPRPCVGSRRSRSALNHTTPPSSPNSCILLRRLWRTEETSVCVFFLRFCWVSLSLSRVLRLTLYFLYSVHLQCRVPWQNGLLESKNGKSPTPEFKTLIENVKFLLVFLDLVWIYSFCGGKCLICSVLLHFGGKKQQKHTRMLSFVWAQALNYLYFL